MDISLHRNHETQFVSLAPTLNSTWLNGFLHVLRKYIYDLFNVFGRKWLICFTQTLMSHRQGYLFVTAATEHYKNRNRTGTIAKISKKIKKGRNRHIYIFTWCSAKLTAVFFLFFFNVLTFILLFLGFSRSWSFGSFWTKRKLIQKTYIAQTFRDVAFWVIWSVMYMISHQPRRMCFVFFSFVSYFKVGYIMLNNGFIWLCYSCIDHLCCILMRMQGTF